MKIWFFGLIILLVMSVGVLSWIFYDSTTSLHKQILKSEQRYKDSIMQNIVSLQKQREDLTKKIDSLQETLSDKTEKIRQQIQNIKININVPSVNYNSLTDSALVSRLLAD
jgi:peptidoglycan hydrolase CwlO-like protein